METTTTTTADAVTPLAVTVRRACELSGLGATTIWGYIRTGHLIAVRPLGTRRTLVEYASLTRLLVPAIDVQPAPRRRGRPRKAASTTATP
jgi:hypothetical protein